MDQRSRKPKGFGAELSLIRSRASDVWRLVSRRDKAVLASAAGVMALTSFSHTAVPILLGSLIDALEKGLRAGGAEASSLGSTAAIYLGLMGGAYIVRECLQVFRRFLVEKTCTRIEKDLIVGLVSHILRMDLSRFTRERVGALHGRLHRSVSGLVRLLRLSFLDFFPTIFVGGFAIAAAITKQPWLGGVMMLVIPAALAITVRQLVSQNPVRLDLMRSVETMDGMIVEQLSGIDHVRASNTHAQEVSRVSRAAEDRRAREVRHHTTMAMYGSVKALNEAFFHLVVIALAIWLAMSGKATIGDILIFSMLFLNVMSPLHEIHRAIDEGHECSLRVQDYLKLMEEPLDRSYSTPETPVSPRLIDDLPVIESEGLHVDYPNGNGERKRALAGVSARIRHGEVIGVAGRSGSGKSTWLRVLMRLTHPTEGSVTLGGIPIDTVSREDLGHLAGYVSQTPFLFSGTIAENIAYGCNGASMDEIRKAAEMGCIHDEILLMPGGYDAHVAEGGRNLSGGQRQRLALARMFLKNPPILILDEGTSALDNISERLVHEALSRARADRTVILVAHRLSTLRDTHRIFVFDDGRIVESGSYSELLRAGGVFTQLVQSAERSEEPAASAV
jgi:ATP-binding cassette, subfamily B, bacterial